MQETKASTLTATILHRVRAWEIGIAAVLLSICYLGGLALADRLAPVSARAPVIGVVRFDSEITFETANQFITVVEAARQDASVAAVVLEVLSPGGYATSSESIFYSLLRLRDKKPLVVVIDGLAASGGYYMAAAGNRIYAPASSYVGNVGTRSGRPSDPAIAPDELSSGPFKLEGGSRFDQIHQLDLVKNAFVANVVNQRQHAAMNPLRITPAELAEARIYLGSEALALGLIDAEGGRSEGVLAAAELAGLTDYRVVDLPEYLGFQETEAHQDLVAAAQAILVSAPPGTIFMLDTRIPFPETRLPPALERLRKDRSHIDPVWSATLPTRASTAVQP